MGMKGSSVCRRKNDRSKRSTGGGEIRRGKDQPGKSSDATQGKGETCLQAGQTKRPVRPLGHRNCRGKNLCQGKGKLTMRIRKGEEDGKGRRTKYKGKGEKNVHPPDPGGKKLDAQKNDRWFGRQKEGV